jgi:hypothetical protein
MKVTETFSSEIHKICLDYHFWISCPEMDLDKGSWEHEKCTSDDPEEQKMFDQEEYFMMCLPTDFEGVTFTYGSIPIKSEELQAIVNRYDGKMLLLESDEEYEIDGEIDSFSYQGWKAHLRFKSYENMRRALFEVCNLFDREPDDYVDHKFDREEFTHGCYVDAPHSLNRLIIKELRKLQNLESVWTYVPNAITKV